MANILKHSVTVLLCTFFALAPVAFAQVTAATTNKVTTVKGVSLRVYCTLSVFPFFWMDTKKCQEKISGTTSTVSTTNSSNTNISDGQINDIVNILSSK